MCQKNYTDPNKMLCQKIAVKNVPKMCVLKKFSEKTSGKNFVCQKIYLK